MDALAIAYVVPWTTRIGRQFALTPRILRRLDLSSMTKTMALRVLY